MGRLARPLAVLPAPLAPADFVPDAASSLAKASGSRAAGGRIDGSTSLNTPARASTNTARASRRMEPKEERKIAPVSAHGPVRQGRIAPRAVLPGDHGAAAASPAFETHA